MNRPLRVLSLQPYFGGSHEQFQNGWVKQSRHHWTTLSLPPRHWKWRMRHAGIHFSGKLKPLVAAGDRWDVIFCTDMLNVADFKGLIGPELAAVPIIVYFHENQFAYPNRVGFKRDEHFAFTNFTTALAADRVWFNSRFNFDSMVDGLNKQSKRWPDHQPLDAIASLELKMEVQSPGIETPPIDVNHFLQRRIERADQSTPMHIVWAARWEHDKNAEDLLATLKLLDRDKIPFQLSVLGQSFRYSPPAFDEIQTLFSDRIRRWGYQESREQFWIALAEADIIVSTAKHEFFGLAAAEAIAAGLRPLFPDRLAYPELLGLAVEPEEVKKHLFDGTATGLAAALSALHTERVARACPFNLTMATQLIDKISWDRRARQLDDALAVVAKRE